MRPFFLVLVLLGAFPGAARAQLPTLALDPVVSAGAPLGLVHAGDARRFIVERAGRIRILMPDGSILAEPFLDITGLVDTTGEGGLLSVAFHPDFATNRTFYVSYTRMGPITSVVARYRVSQDPNVADPFSAGELFTLVQPASNHNGGQLAFSPADSRALLYASLGDGGGSGDAQCRAQDDANLYGTILRFDVTGAPETAPYYTAPPDPPFGAPGRELVWAKGLRNPWRFSFDRATGDLYIGDVGQGSREEIDFQPATSAGGENYGWRVMEGDRCFVPFPGSQSCPVDTPPCDDPAYTDPVHVYANGGAGEPCAVTGGFVYRGGAIPDLVGAYLFGDYCTGDVWALERDGETWSASAPLLTTGFGLTAFGEDSDGELYAMVGNEISRIVAVGGPPPPTAQTPGQRKCLKGLLADFARVAKVSGADAGRCLDTGARNKLDSTIEVCVAGDARGRIAAAGARTHARAAKRCARLPDFGPDDPAIVNTSAAPIASDTLHDVFGADLDAAVALRATDRAMARCQRAVARDLLACQRARIQAFERCAKRGLATGAVADADDLAACVDVDAETKVARACDPTRGRIVTRMGRQCADLDLAEAVPGCGVADPVAAAACVRTRVTCRTCRALNAAGALAADCDGLDDGTANQSCPRD